jgi:Na+-transporting NADH:ubiquinone oxidoreductase subunit A
MGKTVHIRKGFDIKLVGKAVAETAHAPTSSIFAVQPPDFRTLIPKLIAKQGDEVLAGQQLFYDKDRPEIKITSPISGEVVEIVRGAKRRIMEVRIVPDKENRYISFDIPDQLTKENVTEVLLESGCWSYIRQRPFSTIANPENSPKAIFVSCFDSAPLAPDNDYILKDEKESFQRGLSVLNTLAEGNLNVGIADGQSDLVRDVISSDKTHQIKGPHPAGNVGIQIHHINRIKKGEIVWYVNPQDVVIIGRLFTNGKYQAERTIAITGSLVKNPSYVKVLTGQPLKDIIGDKITFNDNTRVIQGNVLTGRTAYEDSFLSFYETQISAIPEGKEPEFFGWLLPGLDKLSLSRSYFSWFTPKKKYDLTTNTHGEERAFVMSGEYEKVLPMDIMPVQLLKSIMAQDLERMENLGIYEVSEEDFALCEFVCTSKIDVQRVIAEGLEYFRIEG